MKKWLVVFCVIMVFAFIGGTALGNGYGHGSPAPNSGDGVSDGSGFEEVPPSPGRGPAPNSGDGIPDGSGF